MIRRLAIAVLLVVGPALGAHAAEPAGPGRCAATPAMTAALARLGRPEAGLMIAAHRGGHSRAPQNGLAAIEAVSALVAHRRGNFTKESPGR